MQYHNPIYWHLDIPGRAIVRRDGTGVEEGGIGNETARISFPEVELLLVPFLREGHFIEERLVPESREADLKIIHRLIDKLPNPKT